MKGVATQIQSGCPSLQPGLISQLVFSPAPSRGERLIVWFWFYWPQFSVPVIVATLEGGEGDYVGDVPGFCLLMAMTWAQEQEDLQSVEHDVL